MKQSKVIYLQSYFPEVRPEPVPVRRKNTIVRLFHGFCELLDSLASVAIALCVFVCMLLFFTML